MKDVLFNSRSGLDKLPFGAVKSGETIRVGLRTVCALKAEKVRLVLHSDADGTETELLLEKVWSEKGFDRFEGSFRAGAPGLWWYGFRLETAEGPRLVSKTENGAALTEAEPLFWQLSVYASDYTTPEWIMGGVFYQIFVDRFHKAGNHPARPGSIVRKDWGGVPKYAPDEDGVTRRNDFFGGDLDGVIEKLPYLAELGVTCIYLNPIFDASSNHKYDTGDYMKIDPAFGDEETFQKLCTEAGQRGIRVLLDGVFNHTGDDSIYFNKYGHYDSAGAYQSKDSPYYDWFRFWEWPEKYDAWWGVSSLPHVQKENMAFRNFICGADGVLQKWIALGASGWRLDVVDELSNGMMEAIRTHVKAAKPDALLIGEVWEDASNKVAYGERRHYFEGAELDGAMNYPFRTAILNYAFTGDANALREAVETLVENYPKPALDCLMNSLSTHDTWRILTLLSGNEWESEDVRATAKLTPEQLQKVKALNRIATLLQFTLPGVPCVYYGDEAGLEGCEDPFCRRCYPWDHEDAEIMDWYSSLIRLRRENAVFAGGSYHTVKAENGFFAFQRYKSGKSLCVVANMGSETAELPVLSSTQIVLSFGCERRPGSLAVAPQGYAVFG